MGSLSPLRLPIIHFSEENPNSGATGWDSVCHDVLQAFEEFGCFEATYDKVNPELHKAMFGALMDLFNLPLETKCKNISTKPYHGYTANLPQSPLFEAFGIDDAAKLEATHSFSKLMWPEGNPNFCEILDSYMMRVSELDTKVKRMVFQSYGVEKYYDSNIESMTYLLRLMKYKEPMTDETELGVFTHTDKTFFTILQQNQVNGLEVQIKRGQWIRVNPSPSSFIFMVGDSFHAWSNGRVHCPQHCVMMSGNEARYSIGLFSFSRDQIQCPEELVDKEHPLLFKPFNQMDLLSFYYTEEGQKAESTLKAYCAV